MEAIDRLKAPTPSFQKKLRNISITLMGIVGALYAAEVGGQIDLFSVEVEQYLLIATIVLPFIAGTAQTAKADAPD